MEIKSIGYKTTFFGDRMNYYKVTEDNKEYNIVDVAGGMFLDMLWTDNNEFVNANLDKKKEKEIKELFKTTPLVDKLLQDDEEETFFTKYEQKEPEPVVVNPRNDNKYSANEITEIFDVLNNEYDLWGEENKYLDIDQEMCNYANERGCTPDLFKKLIGYKVKVKSKGNHKNDGQMVTYIYTFKSPENVETKIYTEMCLMVGWNHCDEEIIL